MSPALFDGSKPMVMSPLFLGASALVIIAYFIRTLLSRPQKLDFPIVGNPGSVNWQEALREGAARYPNTPFTLPSDPPMVVLPYCTNDEVRLLPEEKISFQKEIECIFLSAHTKFGRNAPAVVKTVKTDLTRHVASTTGPLQDELHYALDTELGTCESWTKVILLQKVLRIVALISGRVFVRKPLSRDEEWLQTSINYTADCIKAKNAAVQWPAWTRYFVAPFLPEIQKVQAHTNKAAELLKPVINGWIRRFREGKVLGGESAASLRVTTAPLHLSTGHTISKGTSVVYDSHAVNLAGPNISSLSHDPSTMPKLDPPNVFSPFRFSSIRNHACPGRFFAGVEIKVVMVELLRNWDFRNIGDTEMKGGERPGNIVLGNLIHPNPAAQLEFKRRA
ncbi:hypothetical protein BTUL_0072g00090 [Botrytis tulipae]|uniref:Cytochrome P450 n=1 Tax=Botrytis tulipae TaxID=87230 RepID=A0A4Z1EW08_9HELO|nr:hypothetical protein BTUL_0072g00090 [Botrytis tulipae]